MTFDNPIDRSHREGRSGATRSEPVTPGSPNGVRAPDGAAFVTGLQPGHTRIVDFGRMFGHGVHAPSVWADWNNAVSEADEANNTRTQLVDVLPRTTPTDWAYLPVCWVGE